MVQTSHWAWTIKILMPIGNSGIPLSQCWRYARHQYLICLTQSSVVLLDHCMRWLDLLFMLFIYF
jgi:hypothetical protein